MEVITPKMQEENVQVRKSISQAHRFWNWVSQTAPNGAVERVLELNGTIAEESWFDDDITPKMFKEELTSGTGAVTVWINSPGGDCVAASQIYTMLMDYKGEVTVKIDGIAASAASVIAMAGTKVLMSPTAMMMVHNPSTAAFGDRRDMEKAIELLDEVKESIINAYEIKTGLSRATLSHLMENETWMNAKKAIELGFADGMLESDKAATEAYLFSTKETDNALINKLKNKVEPTTEKEGRKISELRNELGKIKKFM